MKKIVKKVTAVALACVLVATVFAGCSGKKTEKDSYKVGICQLVQHDALDAATKGFKDALTEKLGDKVTFDEQNAAGDSATCATITNQFVADGVDLIMANATPALQAATASTDQIPIVATSVTDFATALSIDNWTGKTGMNVTGTADCAPLDEQAKMIKELFPDAKTVGLLYCSAEPNSLFQIKEVEKTLTDLGVACKEYSAADSNDIAAVTTTACDECDVLYIPTDNTMASNTEVIANIADPAGKAIVCGEEGICKGCGIATLSISYYDIGYSAGVMAASILTEGANPAEMDVQYASDLTKKYIPERAEKLNVVVPDDYEAITE